MSMLFGNACPFPHELGLFPTPSYIDIHATYYHGFWRVYYSIFVSKKLTSLTASASMRSKNDFPGLGIQQNRTPSVRRDQAQLALVPYTSPSLFDNLNYQCVTRLCHLGLVSRDVQNVRANRLRGFKNFFHPIIPTAIVNIHVSETLSLWSFDDKGLSNALQHVLQFHPELRTSSICDIRCIIRDMEYRIISVFVFENEYRGFDALNLDLRLSVQAS